jgi:hypothetical protein
MKMIQCQLRFKTTNAKPLCGAIMSSRPRADRICTNDISSLSASSRDCKYVCATLKSFLAATAVDAEVVGTPLDVSSSGRLALGVDGPEEDRLVRSTRRFPAVFKICTTSTPACDPIRVTVSFSSIMLIFEDCCDTASCCVEVMTNVRVCILVLSRAKSWVERFCRVVFVCANSEQTVLYIL